MMRRLLPAAGAAAAAVAGTVYEWSRMNAADEHAAEAFLPTQAAAQEMRVVHKKRFLSDAEIDALHSKVVELRELGAGYYTRTADSVVPSENGSWTTTYLQTDQLFQERCPELLAKLKAACWSADAEGGWGILPAAPEVNVRVVEYHQVHPGGALAQPNHYDAGSCVTIDVMLSACGTDFEGGAFGTLEADGSLTSPAFDKGDVVVFPSHKCHCVQPVTAGRRRVLVMELWCGAERTCAHRCELHWGVCGYSDTVEKWKGRLLQGPQGVAGELY